VIVLREKPCRSDSSQIKSQSIKFLGPGPIMGDGICVVSVSIKNQRSFCFTLKETHAYIYTSQIHSNLRHD
jgi:hypothetical protein